MTGDRFEQLLVVQDHDTLIDQLKHRHENLPERAELKALLARMATLDGELSTARAARDEVANRQSALERDIATSEARIVEIDKRMYSGDITASRELTAMSDEIQSIKRRISSLEDSTLEAMDEREPLDARVAQLDAERADLDARAGELRTSLADQEAAIDDELGREASARSDAAGPVPAELLAQYEKLRARLGGVGAARFEHGTCMGCHLKLPATEIDRLKRLDPTELATCDQCGRILVR